MNVIVSDHWDYTHAVDGDAYPRKADWAPGPWHNEHDRYEWRDNTTGYPCIVLRNRMGALCGYVGIPPGHPLHGVPYQNLDSLHDEDEYHRKMGNTIDVHGGLTFSGPCTGDLICHHPADGEPDNVWWFGFDCNHYNDHGPAMAAMWAQRYPDDPPIQEDPRQYRTYGYVDRQVTALAAQLHLLRLGPLPNER